MNSEMQNQFKVDATSIPFDEVARIFADFNGGIGNGHVRNVPPRLPSNHPGYKVESSFSKEQQPFIDAVSVKLSRILYGTLNTPGFEMPSPLATRITENYLNAKEDGYANAVTLGLTDSIDELMVRHPNLFPAYSAMFDQAGGLGFEIAVGVASVHLLSESGKEFSMLWDFKKHYSRPDFANNHPSTSPRDKRDTEIWCSGQQIAEAIMRESEKASAQLALIPGLLDAYCPNVNNLPPEVNSSISRSLNNQLRKLKDKFEK